MFRGHVAALESLITCFHLPFAIKISFYGQWCEPLAVHGHVRSAAARHNRLWKLERSRLTQPNKITIFVECMKRKRSFPCRFASAFDSFHSKRLNSIQSRCDNGFPFAQMKMQFSLFSTSRRVCFSPRIIYSLQHCNNVLLINRNKRNVARMGDRCSFSSCGRTDFLRRIAAEWMKEMLDGPWVIGCGNFRSHEQGRSGTGD